METPCRQRGARRLRKWLTYRELCVAVLDGLDGHDRDSFVDEVCQSYFRVNVYYPAGCVISDSF